MARQLLRLKAVEAAKKTKPGLYADGGGLYLRVTDGRNAGRRWVFIYRRPSDGKRCEIGFGGVVAVPLVKARKRAEEARALVSDGKDPLTMRDIAAKVPTFGELAEQHIDAMEGSWRNPKHRAQWKMTLRDMPVNTIETRHVLA